MKALATLFYLLFSTISFSQTNGSHFKSEIDLGSGTVFSTFLDLSLSGQEFKITTPQDADVRIMGGKAKLGRILGKSPKKGIIVTIKGIQKGDSLLGDTNIPMVGKLKFKGMLKNNMLSGKFITDGDVIGSLNGVISQSDKIDYQALYPEIVKTIKDNIYAASVLQTGEWKRFEKGFEKLCKEARDDIELFFGFNMLAQKLPFSHLTLLIAQEAAEDEGAESKQKSVVLEDKGNDTAYLLIRNFSSSQKELAQILPKIVNDPSVKNLIIDLRNNGGGGINAAFELAKYIVTEDLEVGYFVTNKLQYSGFELELFKKLPPTQPKSTAAFGEDLKTLPGVKLIFNKPLNAVFKGNLYVLTNGNTGSTCEPMVYALKKSKKALIIGEKTQGGMLAASPFLVSRKYMVMVPIADFYTFDGTRLDKVGVAPDVNVPSDKALDKALELINK